ncbi:hypothetical protein ACVDG8_034555 [Mesorhizobium sp. ORM8.1]
MSIRDNALAGHRFLLDERKSHGGGLISSIRLCRHSEELSATSFLLQADIHPWGSLRADILFVPKGEESLVVAGCLGKQECGQNQSERSRKFAGVHSMHIGCIGQNVS